MVALTEAPRPLRIDPETLETLGPFEWTDGLKCRMNLGSHGRSVVAEIETSELLPPQFRDERALSDPRRMSPGDELRLLFSGRPFIETYRWSPARGLRFTVIDKETGAIVRRSETEACFSFHHVNALKEDGAVVLDLVAYPDARIIDAAHHRRFVSR
jgi:beta,beta-carotene 9',10'-dioxygenase